MLFGSLRFSSCAARHGGRTAAMNMASLHKGDSVHYKHACIKPAKYKEMHPPKKTTNIYYKWWMSVRLSSHYSTWCLFVLAAGTQGDRLQDNMIGISRTWQHQAMTTRIITCFKVDHPKIFNFLLDDPKVSWDTWVTVVIQQTLPLADVSCKWWL